MLGRDRTLAIRQLHHGYNCALSYDEPVHMVHAEGCKMTDEQGQQWLDCINNVAHVGHCEPSVVRAQCEQLATINTNSRFLSHVHSAYILELAQRFPDPLKVTYLTNSGSEANDLALRISRAARPGCAHVAVMEGAYHGHVTSMIECSPYKFWGPGGSGLPAHVHVLPIPDSYRGRHLDGGTSARAAIRAAESAGCRIAAFFCESMLSCGGQIVLPDGYLQDVYREMRKHGAVCIADEVQCGFGRLGNVMWGFQAQDVLPDIVVLGKAMGNGFPLAGVVVTADLAGSFANGMEYFNTTGGNNAACATGLAVLRAIDRLGLRQNAVEVGAYMLGKLKAIQAEWGDLIGDVRGQGLFLGIEVVTDRASQTHAPAMAKWIKERMKARRILLSTDGPYENVLKIKPPMVFSRVDVDVLIGALRDVLAHELPAAKLLIGQRERELMAVMAPRRAAVEAYFDAQAEGDSRDSLRSSQSRM